MYYAFISVVESNVMIRKKEIIQCHDRLFYFNYPRSITMRRIIENSYGHPLKNQKILLSTNFSCAACSQVKVEIESSIFLERIQGDICGLIIPSCGPFHYFIVLIDTSTRWSHVSLLSTRNT